MKVLVLALMCEEKNVKLIREALAIPVQFTHYIMDLEDFEYRIRPRLVALQKDEEA